MDLNLKFNLKLKDGEINFDLSKNFPDKTNTGQIEALTLLDKEKNQSSTNKNIDKDIN